MKPSAMQKKKMMPAERDALTELTKLSAYLLYSEGVIEVKVENQCFVARLEIHEKKEIQ